VAASHGAQLRIESELGAGSTFTLIFPFVEMNDQTQAEAEE
jgi:signal transduction histidine kinase